MDKRNFIFVAFLILISEVLAQTVHVVNGTLGREVILPCLSQQDMMNVYWRYRDTRILCNIIESKVNFEEQDPAFKGRVKSFPSEFAKGNFSIELGKLTKADEGTYTCYFPSISVSETVHLSVTESRSGNIMRSPGIVLLGLLGFILLSI